MSTTTDDLSREPRPDEAEDNAFFPSPYSLSQYTQPKTDFEGVKHDGAYTEGRWKILMIATEEHYVLCENGKMFSTGNHPVEMLLPLHHLIAAGFEVDVATVAGYPAKLELWAMPGEDEAVLATYESLKPKLKQPKKLADVVANDLGPDSDYLAVFNDKFIITLCHRPAALLSVGRDGRESPFKGYSVCVFPGALDEGRNVEIVTFQVICSGWSPTCSPSRGSTSSTTT